MISIRSKIFGAAALLMLAGLGNTAAAQTSTASILVRNNTATTLNLQAQSCIFGTLPRPAVPATIPPGLALPVSASSNLTSNGCQLTYRRSDNSRSCRFVASRIRSSLTGPWNFPTVNVTPSGSGISCTFTITSIDPNPLNGNWSVTLNVT